MRDAEIPEIWRTKCRRLTGFRKFLYYSVVAFPLLFLVLFLFIEREPSLGWVDYIAVITATALLYEAALYGLKFREYHIPQSMDQFRLAVELTAEKLDLHVSNCKQKIAILSVGRGEMIILRKDDRLMVGYSSGIAPAAVYHLLPFRIFDRTEKVFIANLRAVTEGQITTLPPPEREWTLKNTLKRLILYLLSAAFIVSGAVLLLWVHQIGIVLLGILLIFIPLPYLYLDIQVLRHGPDAEP